MIHRFKQSISHISLPEKFTYPFYYTPHPLCILAAEELQHHLTTQIQWRKELSRGKMFGILVVETPTGEIGYLQAFSGNLAHQNRHPGFVPPVFDLLQPQGYFVREEMHISAINQHIISLENDSNYLACKVLLEENVNQAQSAINEAKDALKVAKRLREERRLQHPTEEQLRAMICESQYQKAELKRIERNWKACISVHQNKVEQFSRQIEQLRTERKKRSAALQQWLFDQFQLFNARGERKGLCELFAQTVQKTPPAGAGECAAPKLLQYAFEHRLKPIAMAEFWWGQSPKTEIRHHGHYYPACKGKCEPILTHMLQGLQVEKNPLLTDYHRHIQPEILFEDDWIIAINKPHGMLSAPGKSNHYSLYEWCKNRYPKATGPLLVHRLDMATSGVLLMAKTKEVHKALQTQFKNRSVRKQYIAILDGIPTSESGVINLPLSPDILDRPRQMVSDEYGKTAITHYRIVERQADQTRIALYPHTGRTHQLRVHMAHPHGLHAPILGDELYGRKADRLYLHAELVEFCHPITLVKISIRKEAPF